MQVTRIYTESFELWKMQDDSGCPMPLKSPDGQSGLMQYLSELPHSPSLSLFIPWDLAKCVCRAVFQLKGPKGKAPLYKVRRQAHTHTHTCAHTHRERERERERQNPTFYDDQINYFAGENDGMALSRLQQI